jgi:hypothetical protein
MMTISEPRADRARPRPFHMERDIVSVHEAIRYCYRYVSSAHTTTQFARQVIRDRTARFLARPSDRSAHISCFDLGRRSRRFHDFPVSRPCVNPAIATSTRTRVLRLQTTHTRRIAALMPAFPTAIAKATVDPRTSSQRIPSSTQTPTGLVQHTWRSSSKCARSNAGRFRFVCLA